MTNPRVRHVWRATLLLLVLHSGTSKAQALWEFDAGGRVIGKPTVVDGTIYIAGGQSVHALGLDSEVIWTRELDGETAARISADGGVIYVHSSAGLHALNEQGELMWMHAHEDRGPLVDGRTWGWGPEILPDPWGWYRSAPLVRDGAVLFGSSDGLHAISTTDGEEIWRTPIGPVTGDLVSHGDTVIAACWNNSVYAVEAETGKVRWRFRAAVLATKGIDWVGYAGFHLSPVLDGDRIYVGTRGTYFYAIDADDGTEVWSSKVGSSWIGSPAVVTEDAVYYGLSDGAAVLGHEKERGAQSFFFKTGSLVFAQPGLHDGKLIVGTLAGHLFALDPVTGRGERLMSLGSAEVRYGEFFDPKIIPESLTRYEATAWSVNQMLSEANAILSLAVHENTAYLGTGTGVLYAVKLGSAD